jgi:hypothetical protein
MEKANTAVNSGVVAPMAWLKEMGMYLRDMLPSTMVMQNSVANKQTFHTCFLDLSGLTGVHCARDKP